MKRNKIKKILLGALMTLPIAWVSTACVNDNYSETESSKSEQFSLWLNLTTQSASTRTQEGHILTGATDAESHIDIDGGDFKVYLYDSDGNYLKEFESSDFLTSGDAENGYTATLPLTFSSDDNLKDEDKQLKNIIKNKTPNGLQILVLANWKAFESQNKYPVLSSSGNEAAKSLNSILTNANDYNFSYNAEDGNSWKPDHQASPKKLIPMFGMATVSGYNTLIQGGTYAIFNSVPMLRALAKIEVIDAIKDKGGTASIENVSLSEFNTLGRFIPNVIDNANWNNEGIQVVKPSLPEFPDSYTPATGLKFFQERKTIENNTYTVYTAYVTEMDLGSDLNEERTHLDVTVKSSPTSEVTKDYRIEFWEYLNNSLNENSTSSDYNYILRNHIYSYKVERVNGYDLSLKLNVLGWDATEEELWYYEDIPGKVNPIEWSQYADLDDKISPSVTLHISEASNQILVGKFLIPQPLSGIWHAYLQTIGNAQPKAIEFCKEDGTSFDDEESKKHQQGNIKDFNSENLAKLYIKAAYTTPEHESSFRLVIMVENLGNWMEVDITPEKTVNNYYTIIRQSNEI